MATIPLPALALHTPEQPDIGASVGRMMQLKGMMQQQQSQGIALQQQQQALKDQQIGSAAIREAKGNIDDAIKLASDRGMSLNGLTTLQTHGVELKQKMATLTADQLKNLAATHDNAKGLLQPILDAKPEEQPTLYANARNEILKNPQAYGISDPSQVPEQYPGADALKTVAAINVGGKQLAEDYLKKAQTAEAANRAKEADFKAQQEALTLAGTNSQGITAQQQAQNRFEAARNAETRRHNVATEGQLTPEAIKMAADQFAATGKLPDVGRNNAARAQIINQASLDHPNIALNSAEYKANLESLKGLQKNFDAVTAFENTANKNLDLFLQQAKKVVDFGSPWVNKPLRSLDKNMLGSADQVAYETARQVAVNEIAKVTGSPGLSGQLTDSARHEVSNFNPDNATLAQTYKVATVLRQDMANRHESYAQQIQAIQDRIKQKPGDSNGGGAITVTDPSGGSHTFKTQADADKFKSLAGIK